MSSVAGIEASGPPLEFAKSLETMVAKYDIIVVAEVTGIVGRRSIPVLSDPAEGGYLTPDANSASLFNATLPSGSPPPAAAAISSATFSC